jgi:predicted transcriptional regulator of viral defense system
LKYGKKLTPLLYIYLFLVIAYKKVIISSKCRKITPRGYELFINYLNHLRSVGKRHFTFGQLVDELKISVNSAKSGLYRLKRQGNLISPYKGLYVIVPPEHQPQGSIPAEDLVVILMDHLGADYYVSLLSAAMYHGAAHQKPASFQVISNKHIKHPLEFGQIKVEFTYKKRITGLPTKNYTVSTGYLRVATPELTAMDLLLYINKSGGLNHIATVLSELIEVIDADKIIQLAEMQEGKAWVQRLGYIIEKIDSMEEDKAKEIVYTLGRYLSNKRMTFVPLASEMPRTHSTRSRKWMVIENTTIESDL